MDLSNNNHCATCGTQLHGPICHQCGQVKSIHRWSIPILFQQFLHQITNIEKGFFYTARLLFTAPGKLVNNYWKGKTVVYYNPFRYLLIWTTINLLITHWLGIDDMLQASMEPASLEEQFGAERMESADQQFDSWLNFLVLLIIPVISWVTNWLFKKSGKNYAEHLIMNSYIFGQQALITSFTNFVFYLFPVLFSGYLVFNFLVGLGYNTLVFAKTFKERWGIVLAKSLLIGIIGMLTFFALVVIFSGLAVMLS